MKPSNINSSISLTGHYALHVPLRTSHPRESPFQPAKLAGVKGFWLKSEALANLSLSLDYEGAQLSIRVHLKGLEFLNYKMPLTGFQCTVLSPNHTGTGSWLLAASFPLQRSEGACVRITRPVVPSNLAMQDYKSFSV
jgi:hypothetical protein